MPVIPTVALQIGPEFRERLKDVARVVFIAGIESADADMPKPVLEEAFEAWFIAQGPSSAFWTAVDALVDAPVIKVESTAL